MKKRESSSRSEANVTIYNQWYLNEGTGQPVVLLHGLFGDLRMWNSTVKALTVNHRVIIPRLPLFDLPTDSTNLPYLVDVLHSFIIWNNLNDVIIVGHGMGSQLALLYASTYPANVDRVVISGSTGDLVNDKVDFDLVEEKVQTAFYQPDLIPRKLVDHIFSTVQLASNRISIDALIGSAHQTRATFLINIECPVLLLWGLEDKISPPESAMHFHDFLQKSVVHFIDRCGHVPMVEQPEAYNWHLTQFING